MTERVPLFRPNPSHPKLRLPPGSWDTHCHVLGPTDKFPFAATTTVNFADAPKEKLFALHAMLGIERCVIVHTAAHGMDLRVTEHAVPYARKLVTEFPDRVVWGTDWPHPHHKGPIPDDGRLVDLIGEIAPSGELRRKLMDDNPRRLYDMRVVS